MSKLTICPNCNYEVVIEDSEINKSKSQCSNCKKQFNNPFGKEDAVLTQTKNLLIIFSIIAIFGFGYNIIKSNDETDEESKPIYIRGEDEYVQNPKSAVNIFNQTNSYQEVGNTSIYTIHCTIKNVSDRLIGSVRLKGVFYDKTGKVVGTGTGIGLNIPAGSLKTIDIQGVDIDNPYKFQCEVEDVMF